MDRETREEFRRVWENVDVTGKAVVKLSTQMESVIARLDFNNKTGAGIFIALIADIVTHFIH